MQIYRLFLYSLSLLYINFGTVLIELGVNVRFSQPQIKVFFLFRLTVCGPVILKQGPQTTIDRLIKNGEPLGLPR